MKDKQLEWQKRIETWHASGMSIAAWCRQEAVNMHQMYYWKRKCDQAIHSEDEKPTDWISLTHMDACRDKHESIVIRLDHVSIEIKPHVDRQLLSDMIYLLKYQ